MPYPKRQHGFTLIEVIVVIALLGLLMAYVAPEMFGRADQAKRKAASIQLEKIGAAVELYKLETGYFPQRLDELVTRPTGMANWRGPYLKKKSLLKDPWDRALVYTQPGAHGRFDLLSLGGDGEPGGEGDAADVVSWQ